MNIILLHVVTIIDTVAMASNLYCIYPCMFSSVIMCTFVPVAMLASVDIYILCVCVCVCACVCA